MKFNEIITQLSALNGTPTTQRLSHHYLDLDLSSSFIPDNAFDFFNAASKKLDLHTKYKSLLNGDVVNPSENRPALHHLTRNLKKNSFFSTQAKKLATFIEQINCNKIQHLSNIDTVVQIGVGGSFLGPKAIYEALLNYCNSHNYSVKRKAKFISHIDPLEFKSIMNDINPKTTLFLIASKSGTTIETKSNYNLLKYWWTHEKGLSQSDLKNHCVSLCCKNVYIDSDSVANQRFYINEAIGGRFSSTSVIGTCLLGLCFGTDILNKFLDGAKAGDDNACLSDFSKNTALNAAWSSVWYRNVKNYCTKGIMSYSYALRKFPNHLQQLICESNGKSVDLTNLPINYDTSAIIVSGEGTQCQHSFFQLIHQSKTTIPVEFINILSSSHQEEIYKNSFNQLNECLYGQIQALKVGQENTENPNQHFSGSRPSLLITLKQLCPFSIGQLLSFYENRTIFEGFIWNINSFDQEGVQLGKALTKEILTSS